MPPKPPKKGTAISPPTDSPITDAFEKATQPSDLYTKVASQIETAFNDRGAWNEKRTLYHKMRMRIRKNKTYPFEGSSNLRLPTLEKYIRKYKASLFNVLWGSKPKAIVIPEPSGNFDSAFKLEHYLDWLVEQKIKAARKMVMLIDKVAEKGFSFVEVIWKMVDEKRRITINLDEIPSEVLQMVYAAEDEEKLQETLAKLFDMDLSETVRDQNMESIAKALEAFRAGKRSVQIDVYDETYNNVDWNVVDAEQIIAPTDSFLNPDSARFIAIECYEPWDVVKKKADEGIYDSVAIGDIDALVAIANPTGENSNDMRTSTITKDLREGIERINNPSRNVKLWRTYAWYDLDGDGVEERVVFILAPEFKKVFAKFPYPYAHRKWPVVRFDAEVIDDRWFSSRGFPELLDDIIREIDTQHNQKIDQQTIRNTPMFVFRSGIINPRLVKFVPGQAIPVPGTVPLADALAVLRNESTNAEFSYRDEEMMLKSEMQEILGQTDFSLQSQINRREPRTALESNLQQQSANTVFSLDSLLFSDSISEVLAQTLSLSQQYLPDRVYFSVVGESQSIHMTREEIQGQYIVRVRGNDFINNPSVRFNIATQRTQFLANPLFLQSGIVTPQNLYMLAKRYLQDLGEFAWESMISPPQPQQPAGPPPPITQVQPKFDELTDAEQMQVLASGGIQPDVQGRALAKADELHGAMHGETKKK